MDNPREVYFNYKPNLLLSFKPNYELNYKNGTKGKKKLLLPSFNLELDIEVNTNKILENAFSHFILMQADEGEEDSLCVYGVKEDHLLKTGLEVIVDFFPKGTIIETVYGGGSRNYFFKHKL